MDSPTLISVIIAMIAIVPGLFALINQTNKDKTESKSDIFRVVQNTVFEIIPPLQIEIARLKDEMSFSHGEVFTEKLFKRMYETPVIVRCKYCKSPNIITNLECAQCGAPLEVLNEIVYSKSS